MSLDTVNSEQSGKQDISWEQLIRDSQAKIAEHQKTIVRLRKSLQFFRKQEAAGVPFPVRK